MIARNCIHMRGMVRGVGFRPFVHRLASRLELSGWVRNHPGHVHIEVQGMPQALEVFVQALRAEAPRQARIESVQIDPIPVLSDESATFRIDEGEDSGPATPRFSADLAPCPACLAEMFDPEDRRYLDPFITCAECGPRWTIALAAPYDRRFTVRDEFPPCAACRAESEDPRGRRFHAGPISCPRCGPSLRFDGPEPGPFDPIASLWTALDAGQIGAIKGPGGYHLVCDADRDHAVQELRRRKASDQKPLAVMVASLERARRWCEISPQEAALLESPRRPIVLLRLRPHASPSSGIGQGSPDLGVMLPSSPLHHLIFANRTQRAIVMTSGNLSDQPMAFDDNDARARLAGMADFVLAHDRPIRVRCDDSVTRVAAGSELIVRRARGHVPEPIRLPRDGDSSILALGGQQNVTIGLTRDRLAYLSHDLGDLGESANFQAFEKSVEHFERLFAFSPQVIVHDMHPDYASSAFAHRRGGRLLRVQHHHAHVASGMADNGLDELVIGVALDGSGYGTDGTIWGGEFLVADTSGFHRAAHLRAVPMPGGDRCVREPWRMAFSHLGDAELPPDLLRGRVSDADLALVAAAMPPKVSTPRTSSAGRLFDAVAVLAGLPPCVRVEGRASIELEWRSACERPDGEYPFRIEEGVPLTIDTRPLIAAVARDAVQGVSPGRIGRRFHSTLVALIAEVCGRIRATTGLDAVVLSGGVFLNVLLLEETLERLGRDGFRVYRHRQVPPNDGGLSLGQLAIASAWASRHLTESPERGGADGSGQPRPGRKD